MFKTEARTYFWRSDYKYLYTTVTVVCDKRLYRTEFNLLDERKLGGKKTFSPHGNLKMIFFVVFILGTVKPGISITSVIF